MPAAQVPIPCYAKGLMLALKHSTAAWVHACSVQQEDGGRAGALDLGENGHEAFSGLLERAPWAPYGSSLITAGLPSPRVRACGEPELGHDARQIMHAVGWMACGWHLSIHQR